MSQSSSLVAERDYGAEQIAPGVSLREVEVGANVTALSVLTRGVAVGLGDGEVLALVDGDPLRLGRHDGAVTAVCDLGGGRVLSAGQDGRVLQFSLETSGGAPIALHESSKDWVTECAHHAGAGMTAAAVGRAIVLITADGVGGWLTDHPSTVTGLAFSPRGDQIAASRYDGVTVWSTQDAATPVELYWKGSAIAVSWSPDGRYVAAATQDRELHVWDLATGKDYRLGGFTSKVRQIGWSADSSHLVCSGSDVIAAWPIAGGPGAFPPREIGYVCAAQVSAVAAGRATDRLAGGFSNGAVLIGDAKSGDALIARAGGEGDGGAITRLAWAQGGFDRLYYGTRDNKCGEIRIQAEGGSALS
ncbi:MAG: hypothetical protein KTR21_07600 [Rhodobacteraceae bacterium]|nr:hypothetical protein [Paracoccaceae bacterium]